MNDTELTAMIENLRHAAGELGYALDAHFNPPATMEDLVIITKMVGGNLPKSLESFLKIHNGMTITLSPNTAEAESNMTFGALEIYGTTSIEVVTGSLRSALNGVPFSEYLSDTTQRKAYRCIAIASVAASSCIVYVRDEPRPNGEYAIVQADLDESDIWLCALGDDVETITIATSFEDFLKHAVGNVLAGQCGFRYWNTRRVWTKYGPYMERVASGAFNGKHYPEGQIGKTPALDVSNDRVK